MAKMMMTWKIVAAAILTAATPSQAAELSQVSLAYYGGVAKTSEME